MTQKIEKDSNYQDFVREFCSNLSEITGIPESSFYKKSSDGDEEHLYINLVENNYIKEVCGISIEELYMYYLEGKDIRQLAEDLADVMQDRSSVKIRGVIGKMRNYNDVKEDLFVRLLNADSDPGIPEKFICRQVGDIALTLYVRIDEKQGILYSARIPGEMLSIWNKNADEVIDEALVNTYFLSPPRIYSWERMWREHNYEGENFMNIFWNRRISRGPEGNCLSTVSKRNGAVAIFLPGVARRIASLMQDDLYLAFTSIHEVMVHAASSVRLKDLESVLIDTVTAATEEDEQLSMHIFRYDRETGAMECLESQNEELYL